MAAVLASVFVHLGNKRKLEHSLPDQKQPLSRGSTFSIASPGRTLGTRNNRPRHPATALNRAGGRIALGISPALSRENHLVLLLFLAAHRAWWTLSPHSRPRASNSLGRLKMALEFVCEPVVARNSDHHCVLESRPKLRQIRGRGECGRQAGEKSRSDIWTATRASGH
jgi:hypothetical protein